MGFRQKGKIIEWNPSKGFGFIRSNVGSTKIFIHISDFKHRQYKPKIGDVIVYEIGNGRNNKKKAINAVYEGGFTSATKYKKISRTKRKFYFILPLLLLWVIFSSNKNDTTKIDNHNLENYTEISTSSNKEGLAISDNIQEEEIEKEVSSKYTCDGREYCSQMRSCEEAKFFIRNCPNTKMDGDGDGVPCEKQWCGH